MEQCAVSDAVDAFAGWHPAVTEMVGATDVGARWALHDLAPLERWHTDRVVLLGDAAHAMVPHQGQGAEPDDRGRDRPRRLPCRRRRPAVRAAALHRAAGAGAPPRVQRWSRRVADLMHLPDGPEIAPRDAALADLYSELAWIHAYDAHAERRPAAGVAQRTHVETGIQADRRTSSAAGQSVPHGLSITKRQVPSV